MRNPLENQFVARVDREIERLAREGHAEVTRESVCKAAGVSRDLLRKLASRPTAMPRFDNAARIAHVLGVPVESLLDEEPTEHPNPSPSRGDVRPAAVRAIANYDMQRDLPVQGTAAGAVLGSFELTREVIDYVRRPPALIGVPNAYAIYVTNDSMYPMHSAGELRFVHPGRPVLRGDSVVIQLKNSPNAEPEGYIKLFEGYKDGWLIAKQLNPESTVRYAQATVEKVHKVLTMNDLFGV